MGRLSIVVAAGVCLLAGCLKSTAFHCSDNASCGAGGTCQQTTGYCSFPDPNCPQGKYGDSAGPLAGQCVGGGGGTDGGIDSSIDGPSGSANCYGTGLENVCLTNPAPTLTINAPINTDTEPGCLSAYPSVCA